MRQFKDRNKREKKKEKVKLFGKNSTKEGENIYRKNRHLRKRGGSGGLGWQEERGQGGGQGEGKKKKK